MFQIAMPKSWSKKKRNTMASLPHQQKPDLDNLFKALADALHIDDSHIHRISATKIWSEASGIWIAEPWEGP